MATPPGEEGFFFTFDTSEPAAPEDLMAKWSAPTVPLHSFTTNRLDHDTLARWGQQAEATAKPQRLVLPTHTPEDTMLTVHYQSPPSLHPLTTSSATLEGAVTEANGAAGREEPRDIIPGRYYGGLKVWSCAPDLARLLAADAAAWRARFSAGACVAEVGCGQGVPGLTALLLGARRVIFQDYNAEVLELCVKPNVARTLQSVRMSDGEVTVQFISGDWTALHPPEPHGCDVILGSDVTFDRESCEKLCVLLARWLRRDGGVAYIATKRFYFGTNGGVLELQQRAALCGLRATEVHKVDEDGGMQRVIVLLQW